jgi:hypothetical protein
MEALLATIGTYWREVWPYITLLVTVASALNTAPQPAPGSHWIPVRKVVGFIALGFGGAAPATAPALGTWLLRLAAPYLQDQAEKAIATEAAAAVDKATQEVPHA